MRPLFKPYMPDGIMDELKTLLYSGRLAYGEYGRKFETSLRHYLKTENVLTINSFGSGLTLLLNLFDVAFGAEVIMSPMGCLRSSQPVVCSGAKIVWADIDPNTGTLSPESVKEHITERTKVIIHYHHLGYVGYIDEINQIAKENGILVIEDCLDGIGGIYKGQKVGTCSDAGIISFDAVRLPNAIEGAAIFVRDKALLHRAELKRDLGVDRTCYRDEFGEVISECDITEKGFAVTLNEINSFIALKQMSKIDELLAFRSNHAYQWQAFIKEQDKDFRSLSIVPETTPNYWVYGILVREKIKSLKMFRENGYYASGIHFQNNHYSLFGSTEDLPGVEEFHKSFLALPTGWRMNDKS